MARPRAQDYDDKRAAILHRAAELFAAQGYDRTSLLDIAQALGISKALFYHYYNSKDALLHDIIHAHLSELVEMTEAADDASLSPEARFHGVISAILDCYRDADAEHKIQINHLGQLPDDQQAVLMRLERRLVDVMVANVAALNPRLKKPMIKPLAMSVFGTLNWKYMWFREGGQVSAQDYAALVTRLFIAGIRAV
ncbi:MAG: TetR/AcrR family transcriptional regulator [Beijerinckiaceae bacterium]